MHQQYIFTNWYGFDNEHIQTTFQNFSLDTCFQTVPFPKVTTLGFSKKIDPTDIHKQKGIYGGF